MPALLSTSRTLNGMCSRTSTNIVATKKAKINDEFDIVIIPRNKGGATSNATKNRVIRMDLLGLFPTEIFCTADDVSRTMTDQYFFAPRPCCASSSSTSTLPISSYEVLTPSKITIPTTPNNAALADATQVVKLNKCMVRTEVTRQWINKNIKKNTGNRIVPYRCAVNLSKKTSLGLTTENRKRSLFTPSPHTVVSASKRYFRLRSSTQKMTTNDLQSSSRSGRQRPQLKSGGTTITKTPSTGKEYVHKPTGHGTKTFKGSGLLPRSCQKISVSDFLRQTQRPLN